ncbi:hypothetical protein E2C01_085797 [Portunus trituberculatus]|nr:hypothetical protein [Portunus trituberculatus]
MNNVRLR